LVLSINKAESSLLEMSLRSLMITIGWSLSNKEVIKLTHPKQKIICLTPTRFVGQGSIILENNVVFGVVQSANSFNESRIEVRNKDSVINFGEGCVINNMADICSDGATISVGKRCLIGPNFRAYDSNFHQLPIELRHIRDDRPKAVFIGDDVFIGTGVTILKGVNIGYGSIIGAESVLQTNFTAPPLSIIQGNSASIIGAVGFD